jgi:hypothetical protein
MNLTVFTDEAGKILFIQNSNKVNNVEGLDHTFNGQASILPQAGQYLHNIDIPTEFQKIPLTQLVTKFRVNLKAEKPELQSLEEV